MANEKGAAEDNNIIIINQSRDLSVPKTLKPSINYLAN